MGAQWQAPAGRGKAPGQELAGGPGRMALQYLQQNPVKQWTSAQGKEQAAVG